MEVENINNDLSSLQSSFRVAKRRLGWRKHAIHTSRKQKHTKFSLTDFMDSDHDVGGPI
jgi:hypothetical protein